jgi:hypothetical protein
MRVIPSPLASPPRLISSVEPDVLKASASEGEDETRFALKGSSVFCGDARWMFLGIVLGAIALCIAGPIFSRHMYANREVEAPRPLVPVAMKSLSAAPHPLSTPARIIAQVNPALLHVSAIALGHPRLAIINGKELQEGDRLTMHIGNDAGAVTLTVLKISDGRAELTDDGVHIITATLAPQIVRAASTPNAP